MPTPGRSRWGACGFRSTARRRLLCRSVVNLLRCACARSAADRRDPGESGALRPLGGRREGAAREAAGALHPPTHPSSPKSPPRLWVGVSRRERPATHALRAHAAAESRRPQERVKEDSKARGYTLPFATSPLPRDRPVARKLSVSFLVQYWKQPRSIPARSFQPLTHAAAASPSLTLLLLSVLCAAPSVRAPDVVVLGGPRLTGRQAWCSVLSLLPQMVTSALWQCTHGNLGTGKVKGATSELLINVDSRVGLPVLRLPSFAALPLLRVSPFACSLPRSAVMAPLRTSCGRRRCRFVR